MAKPELGTKRTCPESGRKFYDLNKDPIVSPYTGKTYPVSFFEDTAKIAVIEKEEVAEVEDESADVEVVSLEEADEETKTKGKSDDLPDIDEDDDVEIDDDDDDTFLADDDDDDDDDVSDIIGVNDDDDD